MNKLTISKKNIVRDRRGASLVEYIMLVGVIALVALGAFRAFGTSVSKKVTDEAGKVDGIQVE